MAKRIIVAKTVQGFLQPMYQDGIEFLKKFGIGKELNAAITRPRNYVFHKKLFALFDVGFAFWDEYHPSVMHKGRPVIKDPERFRKDITILAGHYHYVTNINGDIRLEADSINYASMSQEEVEKLYSEIINVMLKKVFENADIDAAELDRRAQEILNFDS